MRMPRTRVPSSVSRRVRNVMLRSATSPDNTSLPTINRRAMDTLTLPPWIATLYRGGEAGVGSAPSAATEQSQGGRMPLTQVSLTQEEGVICQIFTKGHIVTADDPVD